MTREEAIKRLKEYAQYFYGIWHDEEEDTKAFDMAIEALSNNITETANDVIESADDVIDGDCDFWIDLKNKKLHIIKPKEEKEQPTIPMFKESEEAYKAWTGEEMGGDGE